MQSARAEIKRNQQRVADIAAGVNIAGEAEPNRFVAMSRIARADSTDSANGF